MPGSCVSLSWLPWVYLPSSTTSLPLPTSRTRLALSQFLRFLAMLLCISPSLSCILACSQDHDCWQPEVCNAQDLLLHVFQAGWNNLMVLHAVDLLGVPYLHIDPIVCQFSLLPHSLLWRLWLGNLLQNISIPSASMKSSTHLSLSLFQCLPSGVHLVPFLLLSPHCCCAHGACFPFGTLYGLMGLLSNTCGLSSFRHLPLSFRRFHHFCLLVLPFHLCPVFLLFHQLGLFLQEGNLGINFFRSAHGWEIRSQEENPELPLRSANFPFPHLQQSI
jgi:hypothetical protein